MPDIACQPHQGPQATLNWVGMSGIEIPLRFNTPTGEITLSSYTQAYVNLIDPMSKGIHMSRLYLQLDEISQGEVITLKGLHKTLQGFVASHQGLSDSAFVELEFNYYEKRKSLKSDNQGWKHYPATIRVELKQGKFSAEVSLTIPYSSTCPCSAALSRQIIQEAFTEKFENKELSYAEILEWLGTPEGICATPHSQRSYAQIKLKVTEETALDFSSWINLVENSLQTPVQAAVKRQDEQEFARLNASNLMFCEDSARRLQATLSQENSILDFWVRINHLESLHAHDAVAVVTKGLPNGYIDDPNLMGLIKN